MSNASAKITRQSTGPEMTDYLENEIYNLCESIQDNGKATGTGMASIRFIELFKVSECDGKEAKGAVFGCSKVPIGLSG